MAKKEEKNPNGRPPKFKTVEELETVIDEYFETRTKEDPPTITGLAIALGFLDRKSVYEYKANPKFTHTIKLARLKCEQYAEKLLLNGGVSPAGPIFALKNYGWRDKQEIEMNATVNRVKYDDDDEEL